jgi:transcriptional regulator with XRE-family HTH domain
VDLSRYVGPAIRSFRLEAELSQEELAARADLDRTYISGVERGRRNPTVETLQSIVHALSIGLDSLFGRARELADSSAHATRKQRSRSTKKR